MYVRILIYVYAYINACVFYMSINGYADSLSVWIGPLNAELRFSEPE